MALPPQRLLNDDLFVINRIEATDVDTYKINANDIGIFLLEAPRPPGSSPDDKFVNDGPLNVYGEIPGSGVGYINLHSANEYCEGKLTFREGFYVTGANMDVYVEHDYAEISKNLACLNGGIDGTTTCLKLDMNWLSENILCTGGGLESLGDCIQINLCEHSGLNFAAADGCLEVSLCPGRGIIHHPSDGCLDVDLNYLSQALSCNGLQPSEGKSDAVCMEIDMVWLAANIRCGDPTDPTAENGSGLIDSQDGCIAVDACWVSDQWNLDNPNQPDDVQSIDIAQCKLAINHEWLLQWAKDNINDIKTSGDCISGGGNLFKNEVTIELDVDCIVEKAVAASCAQNGTLTIKDSDGSVLTTYSPCDGNETLKLPDPPDPASCDGKLIIKQGGVKKGEFEPCTGNQTINLDAGAGAPSAPCVEPPLDINGSGCIVFKPAPDTCTALGVITSTRVTNKVPGNPSNPGITIGIDMDDKSSTYGQFIGFCGSPADKRIRLVGLNDWTTDDPCTPSLGSDQSDMAFFTRNKDKKDSSTDVPTSHNDETRVYKNSCIPVSTDTGKNMTFRVSGDRIKADYNSRMNPFGIYDGYEIDHEVGDEADQGFNIDTITEALAGVGTASTIADGIISWERVSEEWLAKGNLEDPYNPQPYAPVLRADRLAAIHPSLAEFGWTEDSFEKYAFADDDPNDQETWGGVRLKADEADRTRKAVKPNEHTLIVLLMVANRRQKARIAELEAKTTRDGTLNTLGIVEYANETAAVNSGLGQGEVYWDTSLERMRAVT